MFFLVQPWPVQRRIGAMIIAFCQVLNVICSTLDCDSKIITVRKSDVVIENIRIKYNYIVTVSERIKNSEDSSV